MIDFLYSSICPTSFSEVIHLLFAWFDFPEFCEKYAKPEDIGGATEEKSSDDEELSEDEYASSDEAVAGQPDP